MSRASDFIRQYEATHQIIDVWNDRDQDTFSVTVNARVVMFKVHGKGKDPIVVNIDEYEEYLQYLIYRGYKLGVLSD